jgi:hypothetical protein
LKNKLFNQCERIWKEIVKLRAGYKSEISGQEAKPAHPHHFHGKSSYALRFDIRGGICLTAGEHNYKAHSGDPSIQIPFYNQMAEYLKKREGKNIIEILEMQKNRSGVSLDIIYLELKQQLQDLKNIPGIKEYGENQGIKKNVNITYDNISKLETGVK